MAIPTLPDPLIVFDATDRDWAKTAEQWEQTCEWAYEQGIDPNETHRIEVYLIDAPFARVYQFAMTADGLRYIDDATGKTAERKPFDVLLSELPPTGTH